MPKNAANWRGIALAHEFGHYLGLPAVPAVALINAAVITGTGGAAFEGTVVVEGDRIVDVAEGGGTVRSGVDASTDCRGRSVLPGLIDAHVHIGALDVDIQQQQHRYFDSEAALLMGRALTELLDRGYTTVRDADGLLLDSSRTGTGNSGRPRDVSVEVHREGGSGQHQHAYRHTRCRPAAVGQRRV